MQQETQKILGDFMGDSLRPFSAKGECGHCNRVRWSTDHTVAVSVEFERKASKDDIIRALVNYRSVPQSVDSPSAPPQPVIYMEENDRPQPRRDVERRAWNGVFVGRLCRSAGA